MKNIWIKQTTVMCVALLSIIFSACGSPAQTPVKAGGPVLVPVSKDLPHQDSLFMEDGKNQQMVPTETKPINSPSEMKPSSPSLFFTLSPNGDPKPFVGDPPPPSQKPARSNDSSSLPKTLDEKLSSLYQKKLSPTALATNADAPIESTFKTAIKSYCKLMESSDLGQVQNLDQFGIVDYTGTSVKPRLFIYNIKNKTWSLITKAGHGGGSSLHLWIKRGTKTILKEGGFEMANFFSNVNNSNESSVGMTIIGTELNLSDDPLIGHFMRTKGIDGDLNSLNYSRGILIHEANFDNPDLHGESPASYGCTSVRNDQIDTIFKLIKGAPVLFFHERMNPEANNTANAKDMELYEKLNRVLGDQDLTKKERSQATLMLETKALKQFQETNRYFNVQSKFVNQPLISEEKCASLLGLD